MLSSNNRLVLGTVQFGINYGIANKSGKPDYSEIEKIILTAWKNGIREFDTAQAYGESESVLGSVFRRNNLEKKVKITTKLNISLNYSYRDIKNKIEESLEKLGCNYLFCLMFHNEDILNKWNYKLENIFQELKTKRYYKNLGVSLYNTQLVKKALDNKLIDFIQIPSNIFDRRFEKEKIFDVAQTKKIYIRSIYLQGLLLMNINQIPGYLSGAIEYIKKLDVLCKKLKLKRKELAIAFVKHAYKKSKIIIGIDNFIQLEENLKIWKKRINKTVINEIKFIFNNIDDYILDPSKW